MTLPETKDYIHRINRVLHFIDENLDETLTLQSISKKAHYSPFHFHRIFKAVTQETLNVYITRKRIEKTAVILLTKKGVTISALSLKYGFRSNSSFTRAFKKFYGISPSEFRKTSPGIYSKIGQVKSKNGQESPILEEYICNINNHKKWIKMNATVTIKDMPRLEMAYITHFGDQGLGETYNKLIKWAKPKGLLEQPNLKMATIYYDSFKITDRDKVRMSACILLNEPIETSGEVGLTNTEAGRYIEGRFEIRVEEFEKSWSGLFVWMNENGYKKADRFPFEIYHNNFNEHPEKKCIVDFYIPVQ